MSSKHVFSTFLISKRDELGMSQAEFSEFLGIPMRTYTAYEYKQNLPKPHMLDSIAETLGVEIYEMFKPIEEIRKEKNHIQKEIDKGLELILSAVAKEFGHEIDTTKYYDLTKEEIDRIKEIDEIMLPILTWKEAKKAVPEYDLGLWLTSFTRFEDSEYAKYRALFFYQKWSPTMSLLGKGSRFVERPGWLMLKYPRLQNWEKEVREMNSREDQEKDVG